MGVYIRGMEMPTSCAFCKLKRRNGKKMICPLLNEEWDIRDPMSADFKLDNCPLVPVPEPHGRLIDADALMRHKGDCYDADGHLLYAVGTGNILCAPTIIQASGGQDDE